MAKGSYNVQDGELPPSTRKDTSYRSFICALLVFMAVCLVILLSTIKWGKTDSPDVPPISNVSKILVLFHF